MYLTRRTGQALATLLLISGMLNTLPALRAADLTVHLENAPATGTVVFLLFDEADRFGDLRSPFRTLTQDLDGRELYRIEAIPAGTYALVVHYDEDSNGRINKNFIGIPREPLGFSNRYRPKGPPSYNRAAFVLTDDQTQRFDVKLSSPLGKRGRFGIGVGVIGRSSPYRDYDAGVYQVIPSAAYIGERLQIYGPNLQLGVLGSGKRRLALTGKYRIGVYDEDESEFLAGMEDRENTVMCGLALQAELPGGLRISASYEHDILGRCGGGAAHLSLRRSVQFGLLRCSPSLAVNWLSADLTNYDFGVPRDKATELRPAYHLDDTLSTQIGLSTSLEITRDWLLMLSANIELLDADVTDSPIVTETYVVKGFCALSYTL